MPRKQKNRRRGKNEGSIYHRSNGKWVGQITVGYDRETGKAIRKYYSSDKQGDVVHWLAMTSAELTGKGTNLLSGDLLLKDFMHQWLTGFKSHQVSSRTGKMRTYSGFRTSYRHVLERHHLDGEGLNLHRFRHTYAPMLLEQGVSPKIVQKLLGHRDVSTTLNIYTHVVPAVFSGVAAAVDEASAQLTAGTYAPKTSTDFVLKQLQILDRKLIEEG